MSLEDVSDPVVPVEPPPTTSHAAAGEERGSAGLRLANADGRRACQVITGTGRGVGRAASGAVGQGHPIANPGEGRLVR